MARSAPEFDPSLLEAMNAVDRCKAILTILCGSKELLLEAVLGGKRNFKLKVAGLTQGLPVSDAMMEAMWGYVWFRRGPNPEAEYEAAVLMREQREAEERAELATLDELAALAHGKNREEEEAKIARVAPAPESVRLPEIKQV